MEAPRTLQDAIIYFKEFENCKAFMVELRWPDGVVRCPHCGSDHVTWLENARIWKCYSKHDRPRFSLKTGTIFEESPISLDKWILAVWQIVNCKNGISSYEVAKAIGVSQKSTWFMDHRIRFALHQGSFEKMMSGHVEADETFIGQKARNMHANVRARKITGTGGKDKTAVMGILERGKDGKQSKVRTTVILRQYGYSVTVLWERPVKLITGGAIREDIISGGSKWESLVPPATVRAVKQLSLRDRLLKLRSSVATDSIEQVNVTQQRGDGPQ
jgi:transposase-like protein